MSTAGLVRAVTVTGAVALLGMTTGCGYSFRGSLDEAYQTVCVVPFANYSKEYNLQAPLTNAIVRKFIVGSRLDVVAAAEADLLLTGAITGYHLKGLTFDENDEVTQFLCVVTAAARLTDAKTGGVIWEEPLMAGETSFYTRASGQSSDRLRGNAEVFLPTVRAYTTEEENRGVSEALEQLASDIFYRTLEPW